MNEVLAQQHPWRGASIGSGGIEIVTPADGIYGGPALQLDWGELKSTLETYGQPAYVQLQLDRGELKFEAEQRNKATAHRFIWTGGN